MASGGGGNGHFTDAEEDNLLSANVATCSISLIGSGFVVGSMIILASKKKKVPAASSRTHSSAHGRFTHALSSLTHHLKPTQLAPHG